ncbi:SpvB/TcaC N-terminal domain-containing protein [Microvirga aerophila]|uniref:Insecticide toxin TcdB middle/N-terminal domain-containing protein n=1 Tax=Microvirga aerophila TaxID=670291 RepID=A0A512BNK2_9HYPH|nr:SpvB/TcaC N-terminal domain-containing protein [Microvirga aerophila]GEO13532.1 hypothetical protein MAE02_12280 [Microvirga aerophila]
MSLHNDDSIISVPKGGGALHGIGEKFVPDLHTGTGNFTLPIDLPPGRNGFQPSLSVTYSTGNGNGLFGLGWQLSVPSISRKTSKGVPRYDDLSDTFIMSGVEDLVRVSGSYPGRVRYRPRIEGMFALIEHVSSPTTNHWEVRTKDGLVHVYGSPRALGGSGDAATLPRPGSPTTPFAWRLSETRDVFGNLIRYQYDIRDTGTEGPHAWDQPLLTDVLYADYGVSPREKFLIHVRLEYESRPDPFSQYRGGFEVRTTRRCHRIVIETHDDAIRPTREYRFNYTADPANGISLLTGCDVVGFDDSGVAVQEMPRVKLGYTQFEPKRRSFQPLTGVDLPTQLLGSPDVAFVDLFGTGLPDLLQINGVVRYWRNRGGGRFDPPREMHQAPAGLSLGQPGVRLLDADGDGRCDLLMSRSGVAGYFPLAFGGRWDRKSFRPYQNAPTFDLDDPEVRLVDLDGDGTTDAIRSGTRLECFFNDAERGWLETRFVERQELDEFPNVSFADPRVRWADMSGDGLNDVVLLYDGNVEYWPSLGRARWGKRVHMRSSPRLPYGYDPARLLLGDVDGDGLADLVYVDDGKVLLWINQSGSGWSEEPIIIHGTPRAHGGLDTVSLVDLLGTGVAGVFWSSELASTGRPHSWFLDFTGGLKPYLLDRMNNGIGAETYIAYESSSSLALSDLAHLRRPWRTTLPFPVLVVKRVEILDRVAGSKLTSELRYHHGYWDGEEREFRGFGMVEQVDTETLEEYNSPGLLGNTGSEAVPQNRFSPPLLTRTWFHQGAVQDESGGWSEMDYREEYWAEDPPLLQGSTQVGSFVAAFPVTPTTSRARRSALRSLKGSIVRTETYALDGTLREQRPYSVTEHAYSVVLVRQNGLAAVLADHLDSSDLSVGQPLVFFPSLRAERTTQWERGDDPQTRLRFVDEYDPFGQPRQETALACPRFWRRASDASSEFLATSTHTLFAQPIDPSVYIYDRPAAIAVYELSALSPVTVQAFAALSANVQRTLSTHTLHFYDGAAFAGLPLGQVGQFGAATATWRMAFSETLLALAFDGERPPYLKAGETAWSPEYPADFRTQLPSRAGYIHVAADAMLPDRCYIPEVRRRYDFQEPGLAVRGLVTAVRSPLGQDASRDSTIRYDAFALLPVALTDPLGLHLTAEYNYRVLKPKLLSDCNGKHTRYTFSPMGLLEGVRMFDDTGNGDQLRDGFRMVFDFNAFELRGEPISVHTARFLYHDSDGSVDLSVRNQTIESRQYSDGFGRIVQTRSLAEDTLFGDIEFGDGVISSLQGKELGTIVGRHRTEDAPPNVVVSGWEVFDNKGRVIRKFEPFFAAGWSYSRPTAAQLGASQRMEYDPRGHLLRTIHSDGSEQRVVPGVPASLDTPDIFAPTCWETYVYDQNDNAGRTHPLTTGSYRHHFDTPTSHASDALGRAVKTTRRNRTSPTNPIETVDVATTYDIRGNVQTITDPLGRVATRCIHDSLNRLLRVESIDAGIKLTVPDASGNLVEERDGRGARRLHAFDRANRPSSIWTRARAADSLVRSEQMEYGDGGTPAQPAAERAAQRKKHRLGRLHRHRDEAGLVVFDAYDIEGRILSKTRRFVRDAEVTAAWRANWDTSGDEILEESRLELSMTYDALGRHRSIRYPRDVNGGRKLLEPTYNRAGMLQSVALNGASYVRHIAYNARGQRTIAHYGNGVVSIQAHDPSTFRLARAWTGRCAQAADYAYDTSGSVPLQDTGFEFDLVGNVIGLNERAPASGTPLSPNALNRLFAYNAIYQLTRATGRECDVPAEPFPWSDSVRCLDWNKSRPYEQTYRYDLTGNLIRLRRAASGSARVTTLTPESTSNRLEAHIANGLTFVCEYDESGNLIKEASSRHYEWDHADRLRQYKTQAGAGPASIEAQYLYDSGGQRVKKVVRRQAGPIESTIYIDGVFERCVKGGESHDLLHIMDNQTRVARVRIGAAFAGDALAAVPVQYHLTDHLNNSNVVLGGTRASHSNFISREEYYPYGATSFGSHARKRYRLAGRERDEESGLYAIGLRYYSPWLTRWTSCDPLALTAGTNAYSYVAGNPLTLVDPRGLEEAQGGQAPAAQGGGRLGPSVDPEVHPDSKNRGAIGTPVHLIVLPVLLARINTQTPYKAVIDADTLPGGSKSGKTEGEIDLIVYAPGTKGVEAHVYDLKPAGGADLEEYTKQIQNYVDHFPSSTKNGGAVLARVGTVLEVIQKTYPKVLDPIELDTPEGKVTITLSLPKSKATLGAVPGFIEYNIRVQRKQDVKVEVWATRPATSTQPALATAPVRDQNPAPAPAPSPAPAPAPVYSSPSRGPTNTQIVVGVLAVATVAIVVFAPGPWKLAAFVPAGVALLVRPKNSGPGA